MRNALNKTHTPGSWWAVIYGGWDSIRIWSDHGSIAILQHHESGPAEAEANARLMAASPKMLEALQKSAMCLATVAGAEETYQEVISAIAEATSQSTVTS